MDWISYPRQKPDEAANYIVSIRRPTNHGDYIFNYVAQYDEATDKWYRYDPFNDEEGKGDEITEFVVGWIADSSNYLG